MLYVESYCKTIELEHMNLILRTWIDANLQGGMYSVGTVSTSTQPSI
jgi:hypothetical protein